MARLRALRLSAALLSMGVCGAQAAAQDGTRYFSITNADGQTVGVQEETYGRDGEPPPGLPTYTRSTQWRYQIHGHGTIEQDDRSGIITGLHGRLAMRRGDKAIQIFPLDIAWLDAQAFGPLLQFMPMGEQEAKVFGLPYFRGVMARVNVVAARQATADAPSAYRLIFVGPWLQQVRGVHIGSDGVAAAVELPMIGFRLMARESGTQAVLTGKGYDIPHDHIPIPYRLSKGALSGQIRYQFTMPIAPDAVPIQAIAGQRVKVTATGWQIDACQSCGDRAPMASDAESLAQWRVANAWLRPDYKPIAAMGQRLAKRELSDTRKMAIVAEWTRDRLTDIDFDGYRAADAAWRSRKGDCTEDALLLASLARAAGIPARVVHGLAFSRGRFHGEAQSFMPHSWVVAFTDGQWRPYDVDLGYDAGYIALTVSDGEPAARNAANVMASLLTMDAMASVKSVKQ